jgi:hypothetical protein
MKPIRDKDYQTIVNLNHDESVVIVNQQDGTMRDHNTFKVKKQPKDKTMEYFEHDKPYQRTFTRAWILLVSQTTNIEFKVAYKMSLMAKAYTNSLEPLRPDSTIKEVASTFNIDRGIVTKVIDKLFKLGVIGKFEVYDRYEHHQNFWLFNPYLSFNGKTIKRDVKSLFSNTFYAFT